MNKKFNGNKIIVWIPLIGFDREKPDLGVSDLLDRMTYTPDGISAFIHHSDFVHQHRGMDKEYKLHPDNCSYGANPRNEERERQDWTNLEVRQLVANLKEKGMPTYLSIMGGTMDSLFHKVWISEHPELCFCRREKLRDRLHVLKRFKDGTYYEDFFADRICEVLLDYDFEGVQVAENFCPTGGPVYTGDFSCDMLDQFVSWSGVAFPAEVFSGYGIDNDESLEKINLRGDWIWKNCRQKWMEFHMWRWEGFWRKICTRLHAINKKAIVLGMYCTDPFETMYCNGIDLKRLIKAGVDCIMPNILPTSAYMEVKERKYYFHKYMEIIPLTAAFVEDGKLVSMLGVKDSTEEWNVLQHVPCRLERDMYTQHSYYLNTGDGLRRCLDGNIICLGDGITATEWQWLNERYETAFADGVEEILAPSVIWSDHALYNTLPEYIKTRRWTVHKHLYEMFKRGSRCGAVLRIENLDKVHGTLFLPRFDLLSEEEKKAVAAYDRGAVVATAAADFNYDTYGIKPEISLTDKFSIQPIKMFAFGTSLSEALKKELADMAAVDDGTENLTDIENARETTYTLLGTLTFSKVTDGFAEALAKLLKNADNENTLFTADMPILPMRLSDGKYRLYIYSTEDEKYAAAEITAKREIKSVTNISRYPVLPAKMLASEDGVIRGFKAKVTPSGTSIVDVELV